MSTTSTTYVLASSKPWNLTRFAARRNTLPGTWVCIGADADLTPELVAALRPRYIFFPHWSARVPDAILSAAECVCFHMTDVPFGRGGSPLQNLIVRGYRQTKVSALRMVGEMDAGPVYGKRDLDLSGTAQEIFDRAAGLCFDLIQQIVRDEPKPLPQLGEPTVFRRRVPSDSIIPLSADTPQLYDHIRMLDAETYPYAFIDHGRFRVTFRNAALTGDAVVAHATFQIREGGKS